MALVYTFSLLALDSETGSSWWENDTTDSHIYICFSLQYDTVMKKKRSEIETIVTNTM